jgi:predicted dehydrogenase
MTQKARIGFIGAGWWATANHMPILAKREDVELTAVCRLGRDELAKVKETFGFRHAYEDYRAMLDEVELDGVFVVSPHSLHYEHARAALERGIPVCVEKPFCTRAADAREVVRLADEKGLHVVVSYGWHYRPLIQEAKRLMESGGVGEVQHVVCHMASPVARLLRGEEAWNPGGNLLFTPEARTWADPEVAGGGYGHAQVSHSSGMLFWLTGLEPESVFAHMSGPGSRVDLYDAVSVRFRNGAVGTVSGAATVPEGSSFQVDIRIFGSEGMLLLDVERDHCELRRWDKSDVVPDLEPGAGKYNCEGPPANFIDLVLGRTSENLAPGWCGLRSVELLDAAYRSAASGRPEAVG